jgi:hypothetical protein
MPGVLLGGTIKGGLGRLALSWVQGRALAAGGFLALGNHRDFVVFTFP